MREFGARNNDECAGDDNDDDDDAEQAQQVFEMGHSPSCSQLVSFGYTRTNYL